MLQKFNNWRKASKLAKSIDVGVITGSVLAPVVYSQVAEAGDYFTKGVNPKVAKVFKKLMEGWKYPKSGNEWIHNFKAFEGTPFRNTWAIDREPYGPTNNDSLIVREGEGEGIMSNIGYDRRFKDDGLDGKLDRYGDASGSQGVIDGRAINPKAQKDFTEIIDYLSK